MSTLKKTVLCIVAVLILICSVGCVSNEDTSSPSGVVVITTTTTTDKTTAVPQATSTTASPTTKTPTTQPPTKAPTTQSPTQTPTTKPVHTHDFKAATCTSPKTCRSCGATEGAALGHSYADGSCFVCGASDPHYVAEKKVWIPTNGGKKYHSRSGCSNMIDPIQVPLSEALSQNFEACKRCH